MSALNDFLQENPDFRKTTPNWILEKIDQKQADVDSPDRELIWKQVANERLEIIGDTRLRSEAEMMTEQAIKFRAMAQSKDELIKKLAYALTDMKDDMTLEQSLAYNPLIQEAQETSFE